MNHKFLKVLACEVACREIGFAAAHSPNTVDLEFLPVGHHDNPKQGRVDLQSRIDAIPAGRYDAILVGYGICNLMLNGLTTRHTPLVIPRAHDCITFFLGSKERYQQVFDACPGTYYFTAGWLEVPVRKLRAQGQPTAAEELAAQSSPFSLGKSYAQLVEKYGEENARYLLEVTERWTQYYQRAVCIGFPFSEKLGIAERVKEICQHHGWEMDALEGDMRLMQRWLDGAWAAADFLIVQPGEAVVPTYNEHIVEALSAKE